MANSIAGLIHQKPSTNEPTDTGKSKKVKIDKGRLLEKKTAFSVRGGRGRRVD